MNRDRSRSRGRDGKAGVAEAAKSGSSEQEIVSVAIRQLPTDIRERLEKLFDEGLLKQGDLDLRSITVFASLNEGLQARVMNHMEGERIYVANARSKSGFLIATCDKAKTGCLDARGLGAIDPWRTALVAMATPKQKILDLKNERDWLDKHEEGKLIKITVKVGGKIEDELGVPDVTVELPLTECSAAIKAKLIAMGVKSVPANKMMLHTDAVGFLKESRTFAFYNLADGTSCTLQERKRAGTRLRADHTVMPKRPKAQTAPPPEAPKEQPALPKLPGLALPGAPAGLPGLPPGLAGLAGLPGLAALGGTAPAPGTAGAKPVGLPGLPALPGLTGMGGLPALPKLGDGSMLALGLGGSMPAPGLGGSMPGIGDPKAMAAMMGGLLPPGGKALGLPGLSMSMPALGLPAMSKGGAMPAGLPGGLPGMPDLSALMGKLGGLAMPPPGMAMMGSTAKAGSPA